MDYPKQEDLLGSDPLLRWIDEHFLRSDPFAFPNSDFRKFVRLVSDQLQVDPNGIFCIGSGAIGLSSNPGKVSGRNLKPFDEKSDLDIAVISEVHFEQAWRDLRNKAQPSLDPMDKLVKENISWQRKRFFDGAILINKLLPVLSFGSSWIAAIERIQERTSILLDRNIDVEIWVYRDYWSVRNYVAQGIVECKKGILA
ncbi:hypothetical protein GCM10022223_36890 [Kineosporia mesophila]|uniref:Nucleotidyltransferase family protein n=1 Tax=Kineosporia mesophila TaxID=566012 RepID=A0ABP6ZQB1_9ACTN|nr:hypothetical protein [Kineosporia mesophila]MCD5349885.1 hypothetical protein [Kineosporia mesophila]